MEKDPPVLFDPCGSLRLKLANEVDLANSGRPSLLSPTAGMVSAEDTDSPRSVTNGTLRFRIGLANPLVNPGVRYRSSKHATTVPRLGLSPNCLLNPSNVRFAGSRTVASGAQLTAWISMTTSARARCEDASVDDAFVTAWLFEAIRNGPAWDEHEKPGSPATLADVIANGDARNKAIFNRDEIEFGVNCLLSIGLIEIIEEQFRLTEEGGTLWNGLPEPFTHDDLQILAAQLQQYEPATPATWKLPKAEHRAAVREYRKRFKEWLREFEGEDVALS